MPGLIYTGYSTQHLSKLALVSRGSQATWKKFTKIVRQYIWGLGYKKIN